MSDTVVKNIHRLEKYSTIARGTQSRNWERAGVSSASSSVLAAEVPECLANQHDRTLQCTEVTVSRQVICGCNT